MGDDRREIGVRSKFLEGGGGGGGGRGGGWVGGSTEGCLKLKA